MAQIGCYFCDGIAQDWCVTCGRAVCENHVRRDSIGDPYCYVCRGE